MFFVVCNTFRVLFIFLGRFRVVLLLYCAVSLVSSFLRCCLCVRCVGVVFVRVCCIIRILHGFCFISRVSLCLQSFADVSCFCSYISMIFVFFVISSIFHVSDDFHGFS